MKHTTRALLWGATAFLISALIVFLAVAFIDWDLAWLNDMPTWKQGERAIFFTYMIVAPVIIGVATTMIYRTNHS